VPTDVEDWREVQEKVAASNEWLIQGKDCGEKQNDEVETILKCFEEIYGKCVDFTDFAANESDKMEWSDVVTEMEWSDVTMETEEMQVGQVYSKELVMKWSGAMWGWRLLKWTLNRCTVKKLREK